MSYLSPNLILYFLFDLDPTQDEFVVLACDGVWNSMTSQNVVDFVSKRIKTAPSLSKICEEVKLPNCYYYISIMFIMFLTEVNFNL